MEQLVKVILASGSPRRRELLAQAGVDFSVEISNEEEFSAKKEPGEMVQELSSLKARAVKRKLEAALRSGDFLTDAQEGTLIVGADTVVASAGKVLGKPEDEADALRILLSLSGKTHSVFTGVCALYADRSGTVLEERSMLFAQETLVEMYPFGEAEAKAYIATGEPMDKAGAYGIQGIGALLVKEIRGDYNNVVGFPLAAFMRLGCQKNIFRI